MFVFLSFVNDVIVQITLLFLVFCGNNVVRYKYRHLQDLRPVPFVHLMCSCMLLFLSFHIAKVYRLCLPYASSIHKILLLCKGLHNSLVASYCVR